MAAYYNEIDPYAAEWLRNLIAAGHIAPGDVDERSIVEVSPDDLRSYTQCHFFAGIGIWSHALRRVGWEDDRPIWSGSCPCQPFSNAGKQEGFDDARHLWPVWFKLIAQCSPPVVVGEQVAGALDWLDLVQADLEAADYAFGASDLCAAGFGGAHIRQRLYFTGLADANEYGHGQLGDGLDREARASEGERQQRQRLRPAAPDGGSTGGVADARHTRLEGRGVLPECSDQCSSGEDSLVGERPRAPDLGGRDADWLLCLDGKWRPVEPGTFPLAHAAPSRVGRLRAYGNGLDAETATQFLGAVRESIDLMDLI